MILTSLNSLRIKIAFDSTTRTDDILFGALEAATSYLASRIDTEFVKVTGHEDFYFIRRSMLFGKSVTARFKLENGFVLSTPAVKVETNDRQDKLVANEAASTKNITAFSLANLERGVVLVSDFDISQKWVRITYDYGFATDTSDDNQFDEAAVPKWLRDAALLYAIFHLDSTNPKLRHEDGDQPDTASVLAQLNTVLDKRVRYEPGAFKPWS